MWCDNENKYLAVSYLPGKPNVSTFRGKSGKWSGHQVCSRRCGGSLQNLDSYKSQIPLLLHRGGILFPFQRAHKEIALPPAPLHHLPPLLHYHRVGYRVPTDRPQLKIPPLSGSLLVMVHFGASTWQRNYVYVETITLTRYLLVNFAVGRWSKIHVNCSTKNPANSC